MNDTLSILIVDDEKPAVEGTLNIIDWESLGIAEVYTAFSKAEAMAILGTRKVNLLLTDIEMPDGSGLDLIQWNRESRKETISIILSGYPNFEYAQRAITLGAYEYLLKPVSDEKLKNALIRAVQACKKTEDNTEPIPEKELISQVKMYIYENISLEISRTDISDYVGLAPNYLSSFFKKETGVTINDFIKQERIQFAKKLLKQTNLPVTQIAQNVGFNSMAYFSSIFRSVTGHTPREYRKSR